MSFDSNVLKKGKKGKQKKELSYWGAVDEHTGA